MLNLYQFYVDITAGSFSPLTSSVVKMSRFGYFYHVKCVQASKCCSDLLHYLWLLRKEFLKYSRLGKNLLDLLCSSQVSSNIRTFHSQRALHQQTSLPVLQGKIS